MSRRRIAARCRAAALMLAPFLLSGTAFAQDGMTGSPPERIDLTVTSEAQSAAEAECERRRDAGLVSGEIIVCGSAPTDQYRPLSREEARNRYAEATKGPSTPDVAGAGIFRGPATVSGLCVPGIFNCPKAPALIVDVRSLPQAPPGSDADRIARGLAPLSEEQRAAATPRTLTEAERAELGLPPPVPAPNPAGSVAPRAPR